VKEGKKKRESWRVWKFWKFEKYPDSLKKIVKKNWGSLHWKKSDTRPTLVVTPLVGTVHFVRRVQNDFSAYYSWSQSGKFNVARSYQNSNEQSVWEALRDNCRSVFVQSKIGKILLNVMSTKIISSEFVTFVSLFVSWYNIVGWSNKLLCCTCNQLRIRCRIFWDQAPFGVSRIFLLQTDLHK